MLTYRQSFAYFGLFLILVVVVAGCGNIQVGETLQLSPQPFLLLPEIKPTSQPQTQQSVLPTYLATGKTINQTPPPPSPTPTPTLYVPGQLFNSDLDIKAGPVSVPIQLQIPSLKVDAPVLGVGLTEDNVMDAPKGSIRDPAWHAAYWYRGSGIPGAPGTATFAGHVNNPLGQPEIFANLIDLQPGDQIIIHDNNTSIDIVFLVDQVKNYSVKESSDPAVMTLIFGPGPSTGTRPQPGIDGLSHLTLITCAGNFFNGQFDHHIVVFATRSQ